MMRWPQRLVVGLPGPELSSEVARWLVQYRPAGVILFSGNVLAWDQLVRLCSGLHALLPGLEISVDHEGGAVSHLAAALDRPPSPWTLGTIDDPQLTFAVHRDTAQRLRTAGVDRVLGPLADVMTAMNNPVIGSRAFGAEETHVSRHVAAAVAGLLAGRVKACLKHWPGHGSAQADTHWEASTSVPEAHGHAMPFQAGIDAGADAVMVGHLPTPGSQLPATLDASFLKLTRQMLTRGDRAPLLFADDVTMGALRGPMARLGAPADDSRNEGLLAPEQLSTTWFEAVERAGCDRILLRGIPWRALPMQGSGTGLEIPEVQQWPDMPPAPSYQRAYAQLPAWLPDDFVDPERHILWHDLSEGDRLWPIGAPSRDLRHELRTRLATLFQGVAVDLGGGRSRCWDRLLVTSFRPWHPQKADVDELRNLLGTKGLAVVCGHPQLGSAAEELLPEGWTVSRFFDLHATEFWLPGSGN